MAIDLSKYPSKSLEELREELINIALTCQKNIGNAPSITGFIAELDAAKVVGVSYEDYCKEMHDTSAVKRGYDFTFKNKCYQVKACRPSGRDGSEITRIPSVKNYEWDILVWIKYDEYFNINEIWQIEIDEFLRHFDGRRNISVIEFTKIAIPLTFKK